MAVGTHISPHTGESVTLTDVGSLVSANLHAAGVTCFAVRAWDLRRCERPVKFLNDCGWLVCGHHTKSDQQCTIVAPGELVRA